MNRLKEIRSGDAKAEDGAGVMTEHLGLYAPVRRGLKTIEANTTRLRKLMAEDKKLAVPEKIKQNAARMATLIDETSGVAQQVKKQLDEIKALDDEFKADTTNSPNHVEMRSNVFNSNARAFHDIMNEYSDVCKESRKDLQDRTRRHLQIVGSDLTTKQIDELVDDPDRAEQVIKQAMVGDSVQGLVNEVSQRHDQILNLERQVLEVFEMFKDLAVLVDIQGEKLELISTHVDEAKTAFKEANTELKKAEQHQKNARSYKCYLLGILMVVLVVVVIALWGSGTFTSDA